MKKWITWIVIWSLLLPMLLCGCTQAGEKGGLGSEVWVESAPLNWGTLESEKLEVLQWNCGRLEETGWHAMVETENGYYYTLGGRIFYADKDKIDNWVLLCNDPKCDHFEVQCSSFSQSGLIAAKDGRLYFLESAGRSPHLYQNPGAGFYIVSTAPDGKDKRMAGLMKDVFTVNDAYMWTAWLDGVWLYYVEDIDERGNSIKTLYAASEDGTWSFQAPEDAAGSYPYSNIIRGDPWFYWRTWSEKHLIQLRDGELIEGMDISLMPDHGGYISGNILRMFETNDGYYDVNTETGEKVKLAPAQLENSASVILSPNCIIESTLFGLVRNNRTEYAMEVFDGERWRSVDLPEEWLSASKNSFLVVRGVSSDAIILAGRDFLNGNNETLYRIPLGGETLRLEYCAAIEMPVEETEEEDK